MILYYFAVFICFFLIAFILRMNRFVFHKLAENSVALVNSLIAEVDEEQKLKQVQHKTAKLVSSLLRILLIIVIAFFIGSFPIFAYSLSTGIAFSTMDFSSFIAILTISIGATIPFIIPTKRKNKTSYSELSQLLHRMALDNYNISHKLFKKETKKIKKRNLKRRDDFVIVSGLARAGTTSLMNDMAKIDRFVSLNYANMPFLMSPNIWKKFYKPRAQKLKERSHKDGIMIGYNSNEALEEYFFKVKAQDSFVQNDHLIEYEISRDDYNDYMNYQTIIKLDDSKLYLAKNNNFILRYNSLRKFNEVFLMVILFREPLTHAASLLEKHEQYIQNQQQDPFVLEYMNWLGHHEFGQNQKFFRFNKVEYENQYDTGSLNYWLKNWIYFYKYLLQIDHHNTMFIDYDNYCKQPRETIRAILQKLNISTTIPGLRAFNNTRKVELAYNEKLFRDSKKVYLELIEKANCPVRR